MGKVLRCAGPQLLLPVGASVSRCRNSGGADAMEMGWEIIQFVSEIWKPVGQAVGSWASAAFWNGRLRM